MVDCRNCINWIDETLEKIKANSPEQPHIFMGCRIFGNLDGNYKLKRCRHYTESENLFTICNKCKITIPKICVSLGECLNCTDTDLYCIESCQGGGSRKYCTHFIRLHTEGIHLIDQDRVFDLFPNQPMPGKQQRNESDKTRDIPRKKKPKSQVL